MKSLLSLSRLRPYLRPYWGLIIGSLLLAIPLSALRLSPAPLVKYLVDELLVQKNSAKLLFFPAIVIVLFLANFVVRFLHYYLMRVVVGKVDQKIKNDLYNHLLGLSADYFTTQSTGTLMSRVASDPQYISPAILAIGTVVREPITFICLFGYAWTLNPKLTLITVLVLPPLAWVFTRTGQNLKRYISKIVEENANIFSSLQETVTGNRIIKAFMLEKYVTQKFQEKTDRYLKTLLKTAVLEEASHPMVELLTAFAIAAVIYYGGTLVLGGNMTAGDLQAFFVAFALMMNPLRTMNDVNIKIFQAAGACDRIFEFMDLKSRQVISKNVKSLSNLQREVEIREVTFAYPDTPERNVLRNVSFKIKKGNIVALTGESGAGKSSLVSLIPRIFDPQKGSICFDGVDIKDLDLVQLRKMIAIVSQDVFLFNDTIFENIRCGDLDASPEKVREAAKKAHALEFIQNLPQGFETVVGDRGQKLSGGERQRVSIARAFLREAPLLILDEATSSLDTASERAVQNALAELMQNRTTLVIAHRLSTVRHADEILVLKDGIIVERGRHDDLVKQGGEYARFHTLGHL
jgi:ATP-binding cassette, subfamily B, bacterial MsbA